MFFLYILSASKIYKIIKPVIEPVIEFFKTSLDVKSQYRIIIVTLEYTCILIKMTRFYLSQMLNDKIEVLHYIYQMVFIQLLLVY